MNTGSNLLLAKLSTGNIILISITVAVLILLVVLYFVGKKLQKKQEKQQQMLESNKQSMTMLIIDKKKMRFKDAGFPQSIVDQIPKMSRRMKFPIVKAKVGPQITSLICDEKIFDSVPIKKEVKAVVSGIYIIEVKGLHGKIEAAPTKKKNIFKRAIESIQEKGGAKPLK